MNNYKYILEPYNGKASRYICPNCGKAYSFARYINTENGEYLDLNVGKCNHQNSCGYHYSPKQYFEDNNFKMNVKTTKIKTYQSKPASFIPADIFKKSLQGYEDNHFVKYLISLFGETVTSELIGRYFIGTSKHWNGATVFWQIDTQGKVRAGKIMLYNPTTGKRVKEPFNHITWVHKALKMPEFELRQCLFGGHLLQDKTKPVAIVESEKTAIIASVYLPQFIWLAAGSSEGLSEEKFRVLQGRNVILYPDINSFEKWNKKAYELSHIYRISISDLLEKKATDEERRQGLDLADYLVQFDYTESLSEQIPSKQKEKSEHEKSVGKVLFASNGLDYYKKSQTIKGSWEKEITELENFFNSHPLPEQPIRLNSFSLIVDVSKFIESHLCVVKAKDGIEVYRPCLVRLQEFKEVLTAKCNQTIDDIHCKNNKTIYNEINR
jgi:hypothetical protein